MQAISLSTGATIANSAEELGFIKLGVCQEFKILKLLQNNILILNNCPFHTIYSLIIKGVSNNYTTQLQTIIQLGIYASYYNKHEYLFLTNSFNNFTDKYINFQINKLNISPYIQFDQYKYYQLHLNNFLPNLISNETKLELTSEKDTNYIEPFKPLTICSKLIDISDNILNDYQAIYRSTNKFDSLTELKYENIEENNNITHISNIINIKNESFSASKFQKLCQKFNFNNHLLLLFYQYSTSSKMYPLPCINPILIRIKFDNKRDIMLKKFIISLLNPDNNCHGPFCDIYYQDHIFSFLHDNIHIKMTIQKVHNYSKDPNFIFNQKIKCIQCKKTMTVPTNAEIPVSSFFNLLIYSDDFFQCTNCIDSNEASLNKKFNEFIHGFEYDNLCVVFKVSHFVTYQIFTCNQSILITNINKSEYYKSYVLELVTVKSKSIDALLNIINNIESKSLSKDTIEFIESKINSINQKCNDMLNEIEIKLNDNIISYRDVKILNMNFISFLYFKFNSIISKIKSDRKLCRSCNLFKQNEFLKYDCIDSFTTYTKQGVDNDKNDVKLKVNDIDVNLMYEIDKTETVFCENDPNSDFDIDHQLFKDRHPSLDNPVSDICNDNISLDTLNSYRPNCESNLSPFKSNEIDKNLKFIDILPFNNDFHLIQYENKVYSFHHNIPSSIISTGLKILNKFKPASNATFLDISSVQSRNIYTLNSDEITTTSFQAGYQYYKNNITKFNYEISSHTPHVDFNEVPNNFKYKITENFNEEIEFYDHDTKFCFISYQHKLFTKFRSLFYSNFTFLTSLQESSLWNVSGGKSKSLFYKTIDNRFIIKQISNTEAKCFEEFLPEYLDFIITSTQDHIQTCLCKILGLYKITISSNYTIKSQNIYIVMENTFFQTEIHKLYDIKGCIRKNLKKVGDGILSDTELVDDLCKNPIHVQHKYMAYLHQMLSRDTRFLEQNCVVDYSLLIGINTQTNQIHVSIVDYIRQYTWDKKLENVVKSSFISGNITRKMPTIVSPIEYRIRFLDAIKLYFLTVPNKWDYMDIIRNSSKYFAFFINSPETEKHHLIKINQPYSITDIFTQDKQI